MSGTRELKVLSKVYTILVVEDDSTLNQLIRRMLEREGFPTLEAASGSEALEKLGSRTDILLLLDYQLPDMNAREVMLALAAAGSDAPVIVLTGQGDEKIAVDLMKLGVRDYLLKDSRVLEILPKTILTVLRETESEQELERVQKQLEEQKLMQQQSQKLEAIGQLAGGVAHDFNNQITVIQNCAERILQKYNTDPQLISYAQKILTAARNSGTLTHQLLAFARKGQVNRQPESVHRIISSVIDMLENTIDRRITIQQRLVAENDMILGDASQIQNTLLNLGINARDAMPEGGVISFETRLLAKDSPQLPEPLAGNDSLLITVSDTGTGIPEDIRHRIFDPFFTTKEVGRGTGLGLAGAYGAAVSHGGDIQVRSEMGAGTAFSIYLPLYTGDAPSEIALSHTQDIQRGSSRIMLLDDEKTIVEMNTEFLNDIGFQTTGFTDFDEALSHYSKHCHEIDLVVLDLNMPKVNGQLAFLEFKKIRPDIEVIFASGYFPQSALEFFEEHNVQCHIYKPYSLETLSGKIHEALCHSS